MDAIILAGSKFIEMKAKDNAYILDGAEKLPIMLVNGFLEGKNIYSTVCDDRAAMHKAASHLIRSGRKRILYLYTSVSYSGNNKLQGYKDALLGVGFIPDPAYIRQCPRDILAAKELLLLLWQEGLKFDAVLTSSDALAAGAVKFALEAKLKIPQEISIIGYNNSILSHCTTPELTSERKRKLHSWEI